MAKGIATGLGRPEDLETKSQTKTLSVNTSASGSIADLQFNNLIIGRRYEVIIHPYFLAISASQMEFRSVHDGLTLTNTRFYNNNSSVQNHLETSDVVEFTATATTLTHTLSINSGTAGTLVSGATRVTLRQLPLDHVETSDFT
jgi:hypothetical protein